MNTKTILLIIFSVNTIFALSIEAKPSFYKCEPGHKFEIKRDKSGARCALTTRDQIKPISCPNITIAGKSFGTFPFAKSGKDKCKGNGRIAGVAGEHNALACPRGFSYKTNYSGNKDKCVKKGKLTIKAPSVKFR